MTITDLLLNFETDPLAVDAVTKRLSNKGKKCAYIKIDSNNLTGPTISSERKIFNDIKTVTRIHIFAHGEMGFPEDVYGYVGNPALNNKIYFNYKTISNYLNHLTVEKNQNEILKINLIVCFSGINENHFAVNLHRDLAVRHKLKTDIFARHQLTTIIQNDEAHAGKKIVRAIEEKNIDHRSNFLNAYFNEWVEDQHQKPGTKSKLTWNQNEEPIQVDAYIDKFAKTSLDICNIMRSYINSNISSQQNMNEMLKEIETTCRNVATLSIDKMNIVEENLRSLKISTGLDDPILLKKLDKINSISSKYTYFGTKETNTNNFCKYAKLACEEIIETLKKNIKIDNREADLKELNNIIQICSKPNEITSKEINDIVSKLTKFKEGHIKGNILKVYKFARKSVFHRSPVEPKILTYS